MTSTADATLQRPRVVELPVELGGLPTRIAVRVSGRAGCPIAVCVHGLSRNAQDFDDLASQLANRYQMVCIDLPGRGDSAPLARSQDYGDQAYLSVAHHVIAHFGSTPVHWIGTSLGGMLGMKLAAQSPNLVRSLVLNDIGAEIDGAELTQVRATAQCPVSVADLAHAQAYMQQRYAEFGPLRASEWQSLTRSSFARTRDGQYRLRFDPKAVASGPIPATVQLWDVWQSVKCPVLILHGERSRILTRATCERMVATHPAAQWIDIPLAGHAPHLTGPQRITPIEDFLARCMRIDSTTT